MSIERATIPKPIILYLAFVCLCLFFFGHDIQYSAHFEAIQDQSGADVAELVENGSVLHKIALTAMAAASAFVLFTGRKRNGLKQALANNLVYIAFLMLGLFSVSWADDPSLALRRASEFSLFSLCTLAVSQTLSLVEIVTFASAASGGFLILGILSEFALRTFHPLSTDYRFCGTLHPNHQAWQCGVLVLSSTALFIMHGGKIRRYYLAMGTLGFIFLFLTKSRTTLGAVVLALLILMSLSLPGKRLLRSFGVASCAFAVVAFASIFLQSTLAALYQAQLAGRGDESVSDLTGRLPLWTIAFQFISERPLTGYGFYAFWTPDHIRYFSDQLGWGVPESHNGFIELLLSLGIPGLLFYLTLILRSCYTFARLARQSESPPAAFPVALYCFFLVVMFCDVIALDVNVVTMLVFAFVWKAGTVVKVQEEWTINGFAYAQT